MQTVEVSRRIQERKINAFDGLFIPVATKPSGRKLEVLALDPAHYKGSPIERRRHVNRHRPMLSV